MTQLTDIAFFDGEAAAGNGVYYLQFPDGNLFGYYNFPTISFLYHYDMGFEAFVPGSAADVYLYDFTSGHWWYTSNTLFPVRVRLRATDVDLLFLEHDEPGPLHHESPLFLQPDHGADLHDVATGCNPAPQPFWVA